MIDKAAYGAKYGKPLKKLGPKNASKIINSSYTSKNKAAHLKRY